MDIIEFCMFELVLVPNFWLNWQFEFLDQIYSKKGISRRKQQAVQGQLQAVAFCVVKINSTVNFEHFEIEIGYILPLSLFLSF